jgi:hypothetical protein
MHRHVCHAYAGLLSYEEYFRDANQQKSVVQGLYRHIYATPCGTNYDQIRQSMYLCGL